ncbi:MAG: response regulator [Lachnospiraceae bacterium]|nr:response regulator [Lachnospiraceae bacterium]
MEINRAILAEGFKDEHEILEAADGEEALELIESNEHIAAVLLDLIMPKMDGLEVLRRMNESKKIVHVPVFIITAENSEKTLMDAYDLGAVDVISKPFMMNFLKCRIENVIELYRHRNELEDIVDEQVKRLSSLNQSMVETLATLIEFRDCESGEHVKRICGLTKILMTTVSDMYPEYYLPKAEIDKIVMSSILHDVGKISIPDGILNKPGRLTKEEFETMKLHTVNGAEILSKIPNMMDEDVFNYSYDISRHHHERWDGRGYPDGLKGDEITIWSQVVAVADVYDALTSPRVYKAAFDHQTAMKMIYGGECGIFNPKVLEAFGKSIQKIEKSDAVIFSQEKEQQE